MNSKTGVLLVNLGTPDSPSVKDVRRYLFEFLNDPRVIDLPALARFILVNIIIVPFRAPKSTIIYKDLWDNNGLPDNRKESPILFYGLSVKEKLQSALGSNYEVELAMRYQKPSLEKVLNGMKEKNYKKIIVVPLFPQYASATAGSVIDKVMKIVRKWWVIPEIKFIGQFYDNEKFLDVIAERTKKYNLEDYDHILFSYHGLPVRQVTKAHPEGRTCADDNCKNEINNNNRYCYNAACYATTRLIASKLKIPEKKYTVCFQSRLDKNWLEPFADKTIIRLAEKGAKKLLVFSPAFVADCLETLIEIGKEYQQLFVEHGGEKVQLVESLNDHPLWVSMLKEVVLKDE